MRNDNTYSTFLFLFLFSRLLARTDPPVAALDLFFTIDTSIELLSSPLPLLLLTLITIASSVPSLLTIASLVPSRIVPALLHLSSP